MINVFDFFQISPLIPISGTSLPFEDLKKIFSCQSPHLILFCCRSFAFHYLKTGHALARSELEIHHIATFRESNARPLLSE
jgi:hypothetical protein